MSFDAAAALRPLRHRAFTLLWTAGLVSTVGSWMQTVAVGALVISRTGSATWAVLVAAGGFLPIGLLSPVGGALADRLPRRLVLSLGNLVSALVAAAIAVLIGAGHDGPATLVALVTLQGSVAALIGPFLQAILPDLVPRAEFLAASSLNSAQFNLGRIVGPALAGITVALLGYPAAFVANAISFFAVVIALAFVRLAPPPGAAGPLLTSLRAGLAAARAEPSCRAAIIMIGLVAFIAAPFIALVPAMAEHLGGGSSTAIAGATAVLTTAQGAGAVLGALVLAPLASWVGRGRLLAGSLAVLPATLLGYAVSPDLWVGAATLFAVGAVYLSVLSGLSTVVQLNAPQAYRGRVLGFFLVALGVAYPLGALAQGPVADQVGIGWLTAGSALLLLAVLGLVALLRPALLRAVRGEPAASQEPASAADRLLTS